MPSLSLLCVAIVLAAEPVPPGLPPLVRLLGTVDDAAIQADILRGMLAALDGRRTVPMPDGWPAVQRKLAASPSPPVRDQALRLGVLFGDTQATAALRLGVLFGDTQATAALRRVVADPKADAAVRAAALQALLARRNPDLVPLLQGLLDEPALRGTAVRGLAAFADPRTPKLLLDRYASFTDSEKADAIHTLASRPAGALALLEAVRTKKVPRADLTAFTIRQMQGLNDQRVNDGIAATWGVPRPASQEKTALMTKYRALLRPEALANADRSRGRALYARTCASCHVLFGEGGKVGPELTGSQRMNIDYLLENILDPSALVPREYQVTVLSLEDGRVVTGIILEETERVVAVQTANEVLRLPRAEIEERRSSPASMMPEGQLASLSDDEVRDLIAYLSGAAQVPLPSGRGGGR